MLVKLDALGVGSIAVAGLTGGAAAIGPAGDVDALGVAGFGRIAASRNRVLIGAVTGGAREIETVGIHVHVDEDVGLL